MMPEPGETPADPPAGGTERSAADGPAAGFGGDEIVVREPDTGREIGRVPLLGPDEVRRLAGRAREAGEGWAARPPKERARHLEALRRQIALRADDVAGVVGRETGKPPADVHLAEVLVSCDLLAWTRRNAPRILATRRAGSWRRPTHRARVRHEPYGLAGVITPWNFPFLLTVSAAASALAAGNSVLLKPSELTPYSSLLFREIAADVLPDPELVQVATGGPETGRAVVDAPVDVLSFTGGAATGREVMAAAARHLTPVILELGGKDAFIVLDDADLGRAAVAAVWGGFFHCGQVCQSVERVYVQRPVHDRFVELAVAEAEGLRVGRRETSDLGPLTRPAQLEVVEDHVRDAVERGAEIRAGGRRLEGDGAFYAPTILTGATREMRVMREETFGPVLPVAAFDRDEDAVSLANDSRYGLDAYVWTGDRKRGWRLGRRLEAGTVMLNDCITNYGLPDLPFGGVKESGFGRAHGEEGLRAFSRTVSEAEPRFLPRRAPHWFPGPEGEGWSRAVVRALHGPGVGRRLRGAGEILRALWAARGR